MPTSYNKVNNSFNTSALSGEIFALIKEENPPIISRFKPALGELLNSKEINELSFNIKDDLSGIDGENDVSIEINNRIIIHEYNSYRKQIKYSLEGELQHGKNIVYIIAKDRSGNITELNGVWYYKN